MRYGQQRTLIAGVCLAAIALAGSQALAQAADAGMDGFYAGTLQITVPNTFDPYFAQRQFSPDHSFVDKEKDKLFHGTWAIQNGKICTTRAGGQQFCNVGVGRKVGDAWADKDPYTGNEVDFTLVEGRPALD